MCGMRSFADLKRVTSAALLAVLAGDGRRRRAPRAGVEEGGRRSRDRR